MGDVLKESAAAAFTFVRARAVELGLAEDFVSRTDIHVHLPAGGVPQRWRGGRHPTVRRGWPQSLPNSR